MAEADEANRYHIPKEATQPIEDRIRRATERELRQWAYDPNCIEMELCVKELAERQATREIRGVLREPVRSSQTDRLSQRPQRLGDIPFDPRTEVSADAIHIASRIVKHLWIIFVLLPVVAVVLLVIAGAIK